MKTIEEKAKAYDDALERFKAFKEKYYTKNTVIGDAIFDKTGEMQRDFESIFSELRESEDERIRKEIIDYFESRLSTAEELEALIYDIERLPIQGVLTHRPCDSYIKFLKALRPGWKPTQEQMRGLKFFLDYHRPQRNAGTTAWKEFDSVDSLYNDLLKLNSL